MVTAIATCALLAGGCAGSDSTVGGVPPTNEPVIEPTTSATVVETTAPDEPLRVGLVAPSASDDRAWTQSMVESIDRVADGRTIELSITDPVIAVADPAAAMRGFAADGVDLVIAHGTEFGGSLEEVAAEYPDVSFMFGSSKDFFGLANVFAYSADAVGGGYVNGVMAAQLTSTDKIGAVGPVPVGDSKAYIDGFVAGVEAQNPDAVVSVEYIDSFSDALLASEAARALVGSGADILTGSAQMAVGAAAVAAEAGVPWFGSQSNQTDLGADVVVASIVYHWEALLNDVLDQIEAGTKGGAALSISVAGGGIEVEFNDDYPLDPGIRASGEAAIAGLVDGTIEILIGG